MRGGDITGLALSSFRGEVGRKDWIPLADILGCIVKCEAQISSPLFFNVRIAVFELSRLVDGRRHPIVYPGN